MARITREQFNKWNAQAQNGFGFDLQYFATWNEKTLTKKIKMDNGNIVEFKIEYDKEFERKTNEYGYRQNVETGRYIPMLYITIWRPTQTGCYTSAGWAKNERLGESETSKKYNVLCNLSARINTDEYMKEICNTKENEEPIRIL